MALHHTRPRPQAELLGPPHQTHFEIQKQSTNFLSCPTVCHLLFGIVTCPPPLLFSTMACLGTPGWSSVQAIHLCAKAQDTTQCTVHFLILPGGHCSRRVPATASHTFDLVLVVFFLSMHHSWPQAPPFWSRTICRDENCLVLASELLLWMATHFLSCLTVRHLALCHA